MTVVLNALLFVLSLCGIRRTSWIGFLNVQNKKKKMSLFLIFCKPCVIAQWSSQYIFPYLRFTALCWLCWTVNFRRINLFSVSAKIFLQTTESPYFCVTFTTIWETCWPLHNPIQTSWEQHVKGADYRSTSFVISRSYFCFSAADSEFHFCPISRAISWKLAPGFSFNTENKFLAVSISTCIQNEQTNSQKYKSAANHSKRWQNCQQIKTYSYLQVWPLWKRRCTMW